MAFFKKFKRNKKFRNNVIIFSVIAIFLLNVLGGGPAAPTQSITQADCDAYNTGGFIITNPHLSECRNSECTIQMNVIPQQWGILGAFVNLLDYLSDLIGVNTNFATCKAQVEIGKYLEAGSQSEANNACASGKATLVQNGHGFFPSLYQCIQGDPANACKAWEKPFGNLLDSVWKNNDIDSCSAKAYLVMGAGVIAILAVL